MYDRQGVLGPWSDIYAIGACIFASMYGYPPTDALARQNKDKLALVLGRLRSIYSDNLIELVEWCMALDPQSRPQSVLALQKQLANTDNLRYQKAGLADRVKAGIGSIGKLFS
jgi:eukaryotic-like serine/threonine-protein kinase